MTHVEATVRKFIANRIMLEKDETVLGLEEPLLEKGIIDSAAMLELVPFLEKEFAVTIADEDVLPENFESILAISNLVQKSTSRTPS